MTTSILTLGNLFGHQFFESSFLDKQNEYEEYDFVIADPTSLNSLFSDVKAIDDISSLLKETRQALFKYMAEGGRVICFLRPVNRQSDNTNYEWLLSGSTKGSVARPAYGTTCKATNAATSWRPYLEYPNIQIFVMWTGEYPKTEPLAYDDIHQAVAVKLVVEKGYLLLLPPLRDKKHQELFIQALWQTKEEEIGKKNFPISPPWVDLHQLRKIAALEEDVIRIETELEDLSIEHEIKKHTAIYLTSLSDLLWEAGFELEKVARKAFQELGFNAESKGDIDLVLSSNFGKAFVEIQGTERMVRIKKVDQLLRYLSKYTMESEDDEVKGIIVGNAFRNLPPNERPGLEEHFSLQVQDFANQHGFVLVPTITLFDLVDKKLMNEMSTGEIQKLIFETTGLLTVTQ